MRHSFGSLLSAGGVAPRTAQAAMRHSSIDLTMNVYTDPRVLDVAGALEALPSLPLGAGPNGPQRTKATGTHGRAAAWAPQSSLAPTLAPNPGKGSKLGASAGNRDRDASNPAHEKTPRKQAFPRGFRDYARRTRTPNPWFRRRAAIRKLRSSIGWGRCCRSSSRVTTYKRSSVALRATRTSRIVHRIAPLSMDSVPILYHAREHWSFGTESTSAIAFDTTIAEGTRRRAGTERKRPRGQRSQLRARVAVDFETRRKNKSV
ncbi:MAG: hypothetical protein ACRDD1_02320 [Planctomycetia bacterium]